MNCENVSSLLISYIDQRGGIAERRQVESHLAGCAACRTRVEEYRALWNVLEELPAAEPSFGFDARLQARIASEARPSWLGWLVPSPRVAFAVVVLLILSLWVSVRPAGVGTSSEQLTAEKQFQMIQDLPVLEDYDVVSNLDVLSDLPVQHSGAPSAKPGSQGQQRQGTL